MMRWEEDAAHGSARALQRKSSILVFDDARLAAQASSLIEQSN
jgi:hypothetical protein